MRVSLPYLTFLVLLGVGVAFVNFRKGERSKPSPMPPSRSDTAATAARVAAGFDVPHPNRIPSDKTNNTGEPWGKYVGSAACARCHQEDYAKWRKSFHSKTLYDADEHSVFGDFTKRYDPKRNRALSDHEDPRQTRIRFAFDVQPFTRSDELTGQKRYYMRVAWRDAAEGGLELHERKYADTYGNSRLPDLGTGIEVEVIYAFGNRMHQPYVARLPGGEHWVLPIYWNDVEKEWLYAGFRSYVTACGDCHVTGIKTSDTGSRAIRMTGPYPKYVVEPEEEGWADGAVGCENCHGPGADHVREVERIGSDRYRALLAEGKKSPTIWDGKRGPFRFQMDGCGRCHNFHTESGCTWIPGPKGYDRAPHYEPVSSASGKFQHYLDGSPRSPCELINVYRTSKMHDAEIGCAECHDPHGTDNWADLTEDIHNNALCIKCHTEYESIEAQTAHSHHKADSAGNKCVECHMPRHFAFTNGEQIMSKQIYSHTFSVPTGRRREGGPPSSCNICHTDRSHTWTREILKEWYGPDVDTETALPRRK